MTLDELLALFPDNTSGDISAADMRTALTELWAHDEDLSARIGALEGAGALYTITGVWQVNQTAGAAPAATQVTHDQATFATSTWLRFTEIDVNGSDLGTALMQASIVYVQMRADRSRWVRYTVSGSPTDAGLYVQVPVTVDDANGGTFTNGQQMIGVIGVTPAP